MQQVIKKKSRGENIHSHRTVRKALICRLVPVGESGRGGKREIDPNNCEERETFKFRFGGKKRGGR